MAEQVVSNRDEASDRPARGRLERRPGTPSDGELLARSLLTGIVYAALLLRRSKEYPHSPEAVAAGAELAGDAADVLWGRVVGRRRSPADTAEGKRALDSLAGRSA